MEKRKKGRNKKGPEKESLGQMRQYMLNKILHVLAFKCPMLRVGLYCISFEETWLRIAGRPTFLVQK